MDLSLSDLSQTVANISTFITLLTIIIHILFAAGVAKDINNLYKFNITPQIVSGMAWVLATLLGGVFVAAVYWILHHSSLARK